MCTLFVARRPTGPLRHHIHVGFSLGELHYSLVRLGLILGFAMLDFNCDCNVQHVSEDHIQSCIILIDIIFG